MNKSKKTVHNFDSAPIWLRESAPYYMCDFYKSGLKTPPPGVSPEGEIFFANF